MRSGILRRTFPNQTSGKAELTMMRISTKGRYALRLMVYLAGRTGEQPVSLREIAENQHLTLKYLESIIALLLRKQLVVSSRGKSGGYRLARPASQCTVYEILQATEGTLEPVRCVSNGQLCPMEAGCPTRPVWLGLQKVIRDYLEGITLCDLAHSPTGEFSYCDGI